MRVLIAGFDLFRSVGGGQTFYRGIIEANPEIEFCYLREREPENAARPANAKPLAYRAHYGHHSLEGFAEPDAPKLLGVSTSPRPKCCRQTRFTITRDASAAASVTIARESSRRPLPS